MRTAIISLFLIVIISILLTAAISCDDGDSECDRCPPDLDDDSADDDTTQGADDDDDDYYDPQVEITEQTPVLNPDGTLSARGWARSALMQYNPEYIPEKLKWREKIWDHYTILTPDFAFAVTVSDIYIASFASFEVIDFKTGEMISGLSLVPGSHGTIPLSPYEDTIYEVGDNFMTIEYDNGKRTVASHIGKSLLSVEFDCLFEIYQDPNDEYAAVVAPFGDKGHFFYENKVPGLPTEGSFTIDGKTYVFDPDNSFAVMDWGRGVWPHSHEWHWGSAAGFVNGEMVAINIGDGWSDDELGTANIQVYKGTVHKLYRVYFDYDPNALMVPWKVTSDGNRLDATLHPFYRQNGGLIILDIGLIIDKMYGKVSGNITLDDGTKVEFENFVGFIEHSIQKW